MRTPLLLAAALAVALPAAAAPEHYTIDARHTFPGFEVGHMGFSLQRGRFNRTEGKVMLDAAAKKGSIDIRIDANSIDTGLDKLEEHLKGEDFFNTAKHPAITFKSTDVQFEGDKVAGARGELTLNGVTKPVSLKASQFNCGDHPMAKVKACGGEFTATIKRSEWNMKYGIPMVADDVLLRINVEALKDK